MNYLDYILIASVFAALGVFIYYYVIITKAHKFRLREWQGNRSYVHDYSMIEKKNNKANTLSWVSVPWQKKVKIYDVPSECVDVGVKGKKFLEAYKISEDEFLYIKDSGFTSDTILSKDKVNFSDGYEAFTPTQRAVLVDQYEKAEANKKKSFLRPEIVVPGAALLMMFVLCIMLMVFWADIAQPALSSHAMALDTQRQNMEIAQSLGIKIQTITPTVKEEGGIKLPAELEALMPD